MWVVKLGGSLADSPLLRDWLALLAEHGAGRVLVVPGGGPFADAVRAAQRRWKFNDTAAHKMAILAMEQYGFMLQALEPRLCLAATEAELKEALAKRLVPVWLCYPMMARDPRIPADWRVTADSLSLRLAMLFHAEALVLVKSVPVAESGAGIEGLCARGFLDEFFAELAPHYDGAICWLHAEETGRMRSALQRAEPPGALLAGGALTPV
ncbi:MAG: hypothetical protein HYY36_05140 [Gammaproteobacteria bacterium]|nr:hypothetical protein [Gammaproteobacteria bacterium]